MNFLVYEQTTGRILRWGTCFPDDFYSQARPGEIVIEGDGTSATHWFDLDECKLREFPPRLSVEHTFDYAAKQWADQRTTNEKADQARYKRSILLQTCDWVVIRASETGQVVSPDWLAYRQALRDITLQSSFPDVIVWPVPPK